MEAVADFEKGDGFGRTAAFYTDCSVVDCVPENSSVFKEDAGSDSLNYVEDFNTNLSLRYSVAEPEIFASMLNGNYMTFADRCGLDMTALGSTGQLIGFGAREEIYSLFGVGTMYTDVITDDFYGIGFTDKITAEDGSEMQTVLAEVPFSEMMDYVISLRAATQGRGRFDFEFIRYDEVPSSIAEKVIAEAKRDQ
jgi:hypothetical protein